MELTESFFAQVAGWEAMKRARGLLAADAVLSSDWSPPLLKGIVQEGSASYRAGLIIKGALDLENLCRCGESQRWGTICAHSVAIGLHYLRSRSGDKVGHAATESQTGAAMKEKLEAAADRRPPLATAARNKIVRRLRRANPGEAGAEPLELSLILPPNLSQALVKGKILVCLEGDWSRGRGPLNALPSERTFALGAQDSAVLDAVENWAGGETPGLIQLNVSQFVELLPRLIGHPSLTLGKSQPLTVLAAPRKVPLRIQLETSGELRMSLKPGYTAPLLLAGTPCWEFHDYAFRPFGLPEAYAGVLQAPITVARTQVPRLLGQDWGQLQAAAELETNFRLEDFELAPARPRFRLRLSGGLAQLQAEMQCAYGERTVVLPAPPTEPPWLPDPQSPRRYALRDLAAEQASQAGLLRAGFQGPDPQGHFHLTGQESVLNFFAGEYPRLEKEWEVTMEERLERSAAKNLERITPQFQITPSGEQWFDLEVEFGTPSGERFTPADIQRLLLGGQSHQRLKNGRIALLDTRAVGEFQEVLRDCDPQQHANGFRLGQAQAGYLAATLQEVGAGPVRAPAEWLAAHTGDATSAPLALGELDAVLRPYQQRGVVWLHFLRQHGFGGILADEMGLGKTLQTLAFFQTLCRSRREEAAAEGGPRSEECGGSLPLLVICPTSLVFNWVAEAQRFTPHLRVLALTGPNRAELFAQIPQHDLVVTSYALVRRDADLYRPWEFEAVVLDEAQHIKNRQTQNAQAVKSLRARQRLVLTGTPLENSVLDLWSIFDFLMPGYLGAAQDFRERYELPITRERDGRAQARLARRIRPFMLRRLKQDVAPELPAKLEQVVLCDLTAEQGAVYRQLLEASRREILETVGAQGLEQNRLKIFTALLRLRQASCDLRLLPLDQVDPATASGKVDLFRELLEEVLDGGHRVLVFSQFVRMLTLLREQLNADGLEHCYLDGATADRAQVIERFQANAQIPVFLISLKAGGVGLNLAGADTVIHFDPWWNPAVEDQATDRAHRIGQTRVVTSYKLIARGTVEEKILHLQARKRELIAAALGGDADPLERLNWEEIQRLLE